MGVRNNLLSSVAVASLIIGNLSHSAHAQQPWTGTYGGVHVGYDWTRFDFSPGSSETSTGAIGGALAGVNFFQSGNIVVGAEADISWLDADAHHTSTSTSTLTTTYFFNGPSSYSLSTITTTTTTSLNAALNWKASLRGRAGLLLTPTVYAYTTAGIAWADVDVKLTVNGVSSGQSGVMLFGGVVGAGTETQLAPNWLARLEILHFMFQQKDITLGSQTTRLDVDETVVRAAVSFKFN